MWEFSPWIAFVLFGMSPVPALANTVQSKEFIITFEARRVCAGKIARIFSSPQSSQQTYTGRVLNSGKLFVMTKLTHDKKWAFARIDGEDVGWVQTEVICHSPYPIQRRICPGKTGQLRYENSPSSAVSGSLPSDTQFIVVGISQDQKWLKISLDNGGVVGWIQTDVVCAPSNARRICKENAKLYSDEWSPDSSEILPMETAVQIGDRSEDGNRIHVTTDGKSGWVAAGSLCYPIPGGGPTTQGPGKLNPFLMENNFCKHTWDEKPGTTDYTTFDKYQNQTASHADRPQSKTLLENGYYKSQNLCARATLIKPCFEKVVLESQEAAAAGFRSWAQRASLDPVVALMAKAQQETKLGTVPDSCSGGSCNGIGMNQIITAIARTGETLGKWDSRWSGVTFNILTNLEFSVRVVHQKSPHARNLYELAYHYNGSGSARSYASIVEQNYRELKSCGL